MAKKIKKTWRIVIRKGLHTSIQYSLYETMPQAYNEAVIISQEIENGRRFINVINSLLLVSEIHQIRVEFLDDKNNWNLNEIVWKRFSSPKYGR